MTIETDYPDYGSLAEGEAPLGFARHFALSEWLEPGYSVNASQDALLCPSSLGSLPAVYVGEFSRADNRFRWSDSALAEGLRELGARKEGFAVLAGESFDADALSPLELGAACSALLAPAAAFLPLVHSAGFGLFFIADAPLILGQLSIGSTMATLRDASRYCRSAKEEWAPSLLRQLGFSCQPNEQGVICRRGEEHFAWSFTSERSELMYGQTRAALRTAVSPSLPALIEQASSHLDEGQDYLAAREALLQAVALDPQSYDAQLQLGRVELAEGRLEQAELRLMLASLLGPKEGYALSLLGDCYALSDKIPQAIAVQERLLVLDPGDASALESLERLKGAL